MIKYIILILSLAVISCNKKSKQSAKVRAQSSEIAQLMDSVATKMVNKPLINSTSIGIL